MVEEKAQEQREATVMVAVFALRSPGLVTAVLERHFFHGVVAVVMTHCCALLEEIGKQRFPWRLGLPGKSSTWPSMAEMAL